MDKNIVAYIVILISLISIIYINYYFLKTLILIKKVMNTIELNKLSKALANPNLSKEDIKNYTEKVTIFTDFIRNEQSEDLELRIKYTKSIIGLL